MLTDLKKLSIEQCRDSGLALVLICLIGSQIWGTSIFIQVAIVFLLIAMTCPLLFHPFAKFWFALSNLLGTIVSKVILAMLFITMVLPVGLARRCIGKDSMQVNCWKKGNGSVLHKRDQTFTAKDLKHPY